MLLESPSLMICVSRCYKCITVSRCYSSMNPVCTRLLEDPDARARLLTLHLGLVLKLKAGLAWAVWRMES